MPNWTTSATPQRRSMKALIIYDDLAAAKQAGATLKRSAHRANIGVNWELKAWRLDILKLPLAGDEALLEAADADLIAFTGPGASSLPCWLKEWLECWANLRQVGNAALIVLGDGAGDLGRAAVQFSRFAKSHRLSLLMENACPLEHVPRSLHVISAGSEPHTQPEVVKTSVTSSPNRDEAKGPAKLYADASY